MPKHIPLPQYELGDHVVLRPREDIADSASPIVHGKIHSLTWNGRTGDHLYSLKVPGLEGEAPEVITVHEFEIWGLIDDSADSAEEAR
jgi:hypothetical protein